MLRAHLAIALAVVSAASAVFLSAPRAARACCADLDRHEPIGWSSDGELLVDAYESSDCEGTSTLDVLVPGDTTPRSRFDRYDGTRRLAEGASPVSLSDDDLWEMEQALEESGAVDEVVLWSEMFPIPSALSRRFATAPRGICREDVIVLGATDPSDELGTPRWEGHVLVTVLLRGAEGYREVASSIRISLGLAEVAKISLLPSPDARHAILRVTFDDPDAAGDQLHWVELPADAPAPRADCAASAPVLPLRDNLTDPQIAQGNWEIEGALSAREALDAATTEEDVAMATAWLIDALTRALWWDPNSDVIRVALADAYASAGAPDLAAEVGRGVGDGPFPPLASLAPPPPPVAPARVPVPVLEVLEVAAQDGPNPKEVALAEANPIAIDELYRDGGLEDGGLDLDPGAYDDVPPGAMGCDATGGAETTFAVALPALVLALGFGAGAFRRRRRR